MLLSGDEAVALAAFHAGVALGTGYPGTPSTEILEEFAALGAYFSFGGAITDPKRGKLRGALVAAPTERLLFETEPDAPGGRAGFLSLPGIVSAAAAQLGRSAEDMAEISRANGIRFLGKISPLRE